MRVMEEKRPIMSLSKEIKCLKRVAKKASQTLARFEKIMTEEEIEVWAYELLEYICNAASIMEGVLERIVTRGYNASVLAELQGLLTNISLDSYEDAYYMVSCIEQMVRETDKIDECCFEPVI